MISISLHDPILVAWAQYLVSPSQHFLLVHAFALGLDPILCGNPDEKNREVYEDKAYACSALCWVLCKAWHKMNTWEAQESSKIAGERLERSLGWVCPPCSQMVHPLLDGYKTTASAWDIYPGGTFPNPVKTSSFISKCHRLLNGTVTIMPWTGAIFSVYLSTILCF